MPSGLICFCWQESGKNDDTNDALVVGAYFATPFYSFIIIC